MPYTGNLLQQRQQPGGRPLPGPSPRHAANEADPSAPRGEHQVPAGTGAEFARSDFDRVVMSGGGMRLDTPASWAGAPSGGMEASPYRITYPAGNPHDSDAVLSGLGSALQTVQGGMRSNAHDGSPDRGYVRTGFDPEPLFARQQERAELATEGQSNPFGSLSDDGVKYVRGINSRPENNPPRVGYVSGYRPGRERVRAWQVPRFAHVSRTIDPQVLRPRDAYTPNPARRQVNTMITPPALPRDAGNPDDPMLARTNYTNAVTSVFGGF